MAKPRSGKRPGWFISGFSRIENAQWAHDMAHQGGVAGFLLTVSEAIGIALGYGGLDVTTWKQGPNVYATNPVEGYIYLGVTGAMVLVLALMSWRTYAGKGFVSAPLLLVLLIYEGCTKAMGGTLGAGWAVVYLGLAFNLFGAIRAAWYLRKAPTAKRDAMMINAFDDKPADGTE